MPEPRPSTGASASRTADPYAVLGVPRSADKAELQRAYRRAVRRTHPDMGGTAAEFAEVQAAWEALTGGGAERVDPWADGDWGVDVNGANNHPAPETEAEPGPDAPPTPPPADTSPTGDVPDHPDPHGHRDPFAPGAVALPESTIALPRRQPRTRQRRIDRALRVTIATGALTVAVTAAVAGSRVGGATYVTAGAWAALLALGVLMAHKLGAGSALSFLAAAWPVAAAPAMAAHPSPASGIVLVGAAVTCIALLWRELRRLRTPSPALDRLRDAARVGPTLERHHLALYWNLVRDALTTPGSSVERLVDSGLANPEQRWLGVDVRTGRSTVRDLGGADVEPEGWIVVDAEGRVIATAPRDAPAAWSATVRQGTGP